MNNPNDYKTELDNILFLIRSVHPDPEFSGTAYDGVNWLQQEYLKEIFSDDHPDIEVMDDLGNEHTIHWEYGDASVGIQSGYVIDGMVVIDEMRTE
jgi:hypothetical protein